MKYLLDALNEDLLRLRAEIALHRVLVDALEKTHQSDPGALREYTSRAKRLIYSNTIVGSYGVIEQTIDSTLANVAEAYNRIYPRYGDMPEAVRSNYRDLVLQCLRDGGRARIRSVINETVAINSLLLDKTDPPALTPSVFTLSTANYRLAYMTSLFNRIGVDLGDAVSSNLPSDQLALAGFANFDSFLADLVQRRNDLAHSYGDNNIIDTEILSAYVEVIASLLRTVIIRTNRNLVSLLAEWRLAPIGTVVKSWTGRIGVNMTAGELETGDRILLSKLNRQTSHEVLSIQSESISYPRIAFEGTPRSVAAAISNVPSNIDHAEVYVIDSEWRDLWPLDDMHLP